MSVPRDYSRRPLPIHPGEFLREDYLPDLGLNAEQFAEALSLPVGEIEAVLGERKDLTAEMCYRLAVYFGTSAEFWTSMQSAYELNTIYHQKRDQISREVLPRVAA